MNDTKMNCQKCNSKMEIGFILDEGHSTSWPLRWIEGKPDKSVWGKIRGVKTMFKTRRYIEAHRCISCGFLELFANEAYSLLDKTSK